MEAVIAALSYPKNYKMRNIVSDKVPKEKKMNNILHPLVHDNPHSNETKRKHKESKKHASSEENDTDTESDSSKDSLSSEDEKEDESSDSDSEIKKKKKREKKHSNKEKVSALLQMNPHHGHDLTEEDTSPSHYSYPSMTNRANQNIELVDLPSVSHIEDIFKKCSSFTLQRIQPDHLKNPYTSKAQTSSAGSGNDASDAEDDSPIDEINKTLEKNISVLFSDENAESKHFSIENIKNSLIEYVKIKTNSRHPNTGRLMSSKQHLDLKTAKATIFSTVQKTEMPNFYIHLLNAMKALMIYVAQNTAKQDMMCKAYEKHCYGAWKEVISYLKTLQMVISSAIKAGFLESKNYEYTIDDIMAARDQTLKSTNQQMDERRRKIIETEKALQLRDEKIREISELYSGQEKQKADLEASLLTLRSQINLINDPVQVAKNNIKLMSPQDN